MKGLKKLALATAVAAAPFAQAELTAMDDALLADMTGQAGITIDVDLQMTIDAIKYVDEDGKSRAPLDLDGNGDTDGPDENSVTGTQGAITAQGLSIGSISDAGALSAAQIRGVTIDADGTDGLTIGFGKIGDTQGNGVDISVDAVLINDGNANLNSFNAVQALNAATFNSAGLEANTYTYQNLVDGDLTADLAASFLTDAGADVAAAAALVTDEVAIAAGFASAADLQTKLGSGSATERGQAAAAIVGVAAADIQENGGSANALSLALGDQVADLGVAKAASDEIASAGGGNVGGIIIEDFRNYIQDDLVAKYNGVFDMALNTSKGVKTSPTAQRTTAYNDAKTAAITPAGGNTYADYADLKAQADAGNTDAQADLAKVDAGTDNEIVNDGASNTALASLNESLNAGRYVRGELSIAGTGTFNGDNATSTGGLKISGKFGGALDKAAWVDYDGEGAGNEFGVKDLGFFHGIDTDNDGLSDTIEGMHFEMKIDVVEHTSAVETGVQVSALQISDIVLEGTIMMGNIYLGGTNTQERSLGSVLVKDINMTGTSVYIYGH